MVLPRPGHQAVRDVVAIPTTSLVRMRGDHRLTSGVGQHARQQARIAGVVAQAPISPALGQAPLHRLPEVCVDDGFVLPRIDVAPMGDLTPIGPILQQMEQGSTGEVTAALTGDAILGEVLLDQTNMSRSPCVPALSLVPGLRRKAGIGANSASNRQFRVRSPPPQARRAAPDRMHQRDRPTWMQPRARTAAAFAPDHAAEGLWATGEALPHPVFSPSRPHRRPLTECS